MKQYLNVLVLIALAGVALFWQQVWGIFAGMTVLESLDIIWTYLAHIAVGTIAMVFITGLPAIITAIIMPWARMFRKRQRAIRRGRLVVQPREPVFKPRKMTAEQLLSVLAPNQKIQKTPVQAPDDRVDLNL